MTKRAKLMGLAAYVVAMGYFAVPARAAEPECQPSPVWTCGAPYDGTFNCEGLGQGALNDICARSNPNPDVCQNTVASCSYFEGCDDYPNGGGAGESVYCVYVYNP